MTGSRSRGAFLAAASAVVLSVAGCGSSVKVTLPSGATHTRTSATSSPSTTSTSEAPPSGTSSSPTATPSPEDLLQEITGNFGAAKSAHLVATYTKNDETRTLDVSGTVDGSNQRTVLTINKDNVKAEIRTVAARVYVNGNEAYYRYSGVPSNRAKQVAGRWLSIPASTAAATTRDFTLQAIFTDLKSKLRTSQTAGLVVTSSTHNGQQVWRASNSQTTIVVAADGSGRLLSASNDGLLNDQSYTFDQWDSAPTVDAPSNSMTT